MDDIKLAFQFISEAYQEVANGREQIRGIFDMIESKLGKVEKVLTSIQQQNDQTPRSDD